MSRDPKYAAPEHPPRRCGRLDPHESHDWTGREQTGDDIFAPRRVLTFTCTGHVVIEGAAECVEHQTPVADCRYQHEVERRARWSE